MPREKLSVEENWMELGRYLSRNFYEWEKYSHSLEKASELAWASYIKAHKEQEDVCSTDDYLRHISFMLLGYSLETRLKAAIVKQDSEAIKRKSFYGHDLLKLVTLAGFEVSELEQDLLKRLTINIIWKGRYPTPKHHSLQTEWALLPGKEERPGNVSVGRIPGLLVLENRRDLTLLLERLSDWLFELEPNCKQVGSLDEK